MYFRPLMLTLALALGQAPMAWSQDDSDASADSVPGVASVEQNDRRDPQEIEAYRQVLERFNARAVEFQEEVGRLVEERKREELGKVSQGYDIKVLELEERERAQRDLAIQRLREFLVRYPTAPDSDNVRFRLAELYYERAIIVWIEEQMRFGERAEEYDLKVEEAQRVFDEEGDPTLLENLEPPDNPEKDLGPSIELYQQIVRRNEPLPPEERWSNLDRAYYSLGFAFMDTQAQQYDLKRARMSFQELLRVAGSDSDLADAAHMFLGKILFEEEKRYEDALQEYKAIVDKGPSSDYYQDAIFQLAWIYYKLAARVEEYEPKALELFTKILDESQQAMIETGRESDYASDARLNLARMIADNAEFDESVRPVDVARSFFERIGERPWERDVYLALAEVLAGCIPEPDPCPGGVTLGRYMVDEAIDVYEALQTDPRWVKEPDNPNYQMKIIWLLPRRFDPDVQTEVPEQQRVLVERYGETFRDPYTGEEKPNPWWIANRNNADALDSVRQFIEGSLSLVAQGLLVQAQESSDPELYRQSADRFREYLNKFPIADNFYINQWYLANALMEAAPQEGERPWRPLEDALREFTSLIQTRDNHPYGDGSIYRLADVRREILKVKVDDYGPLDQLPPNAEREEVVTTDFGKEIEVFKLSEDHRAYIDAMDLVLSYDFQEPFDDSLPDYRDAVAENRAYLLYTPAMILAVHNRFDEARERAEKVIAEVPDTAEASYAANLIVLAYNSEGNLQEVRNQTRRFANMTFDDPEMKEKFGKMYEDASFIQCQQYSQAGERLKAAECYEAYLDEFADTGAEKYKFALYNAAQNYEIYGRAERANDLFERYVNLYPDDDQARKITMRIAGNYEATFELDKAVQYYNLVIDNDPKREFSGTPDAIYNVAFLKVGLADHRGAAQGYERYAKYFPDKEDAVDVLFRAGEQWELVSDRDARDFYQRFLRTYGPGGSASNPNYVIEAQYKLANFLPEGSAAYDRAMDELLETFDRYVEQGITLGPEARNMAAGWAVHRLQQKYDALTDAELTRDEERDFDLIERKAQVEVPEFSREATRVANTYSDFEHGTGALYLLSRAFLWIAELGYSMECPRGYSDDECDLWYELYETDTRPLFEEFEERARAGFTRLIEFAKAQKRHSPWIDRAYSDLNRLDPFNYPDVKQELRGEPEIKVLPDLLPLDVPANGESTDRAPATDPTDPASATDATDAGGPAEVPEPVEDPWGSQ